MIFEIDATHISFNSASQTSEYYIFICVSTLNYISAWMHDSWSLPDETIHKSIEVHWIVSMRTRLTELRCLAGIAVILSLSFRTPFRVPAPANASIIDMRMQMQHLFAFSMPMHSKSAFLCTSTALSFVSPHATSQLISYNGSTHYEVLSLWWFCGHRVCRQVLLKVSARECIYLYHIYSNAATSTTI